MTFKPITPHFHAQLESFQHGLETRERVKAVRGYVSGSKTPRNINYSRASVQAGGALYDAKIAHTEAGHLIPLELGGADSADNLVPMYGEINRGTYRGVERAVAERLAFSPRPAMLVECSYGLVSPDGRIPAWIDVYFYPDVSDLTKVVPMPLYHVRRVHNTRLDPARMTIVGADIDLARRLKEAKGAFAFQSWRVESVLGEVKPGQLPPLDQRPNAWIDWLVYSSHLYKTASEALSKVAPAEFTIGSYRGFADPQIDFVVLCNRMTQPSARLGECWSDQSSDPVQTALTQLGTDDGIHIDHIVPEASGGWNVYSNASVVSALFNKQKGRS